MLSFKSDFLQKILIVLEYNVMIFHMHWMKGVLLLDKFFNLFLFNYYMSFWLSNMYATNQRELIIKHYTT